MAKSKKNTVLATRNGVDKEFSVDQWNSMKKTNSLYGWRAKSDLPEEVISKETDLENSKIADLQKQLDDSNESVKTLTADKEALTTANAELQKQLDDLKASAEKNKAQDKPEPAPKATETPKKK